MVPQPTHLKRMARIDELGQKKWNGSPDTDILAPQSMHSSSTVCFADEFFFFALFVAGSLPRTPMDFFPGSERVDGSCGTSVFAEAGATTRLDVDWGGGCGVETGTDRKSVV